MCFGPRDFPGTPVVIQLQIDYAEVITPLTRHHRRYAIERTLFNVCAFDIGKVLTREHRVSMAEHDGVNTWHLAEVVHRVFRHRFIGFAGQTGVRNRNHQIGTLFTHFWHVTFCGFGDVVNRNFALQVGFIPYQNLWRYKADIANSQSMFFAITVFYRCIDDNVRCEQGFLRFSVDDVSVDIREFGSSNGIFQVVEPVVEFVVPDVANYIVQGIHRFIHWVYITGFQAFGRHIVAERAALNNVAVVDQHRISRLLACLFNQAGGTDQAEFIGWFILVVIEVHHVAVQVGGFQHAQIDRGRLRRGANQHGKGRQCQRTLHHFWLSPFHFSSFIAEGHVINIGCLTKL